MQTELRLEKHATKEGADINRVITVQFLPLSLSIKIIWMVDTGGCFVLQFTFSEDTECLKTWMFDLKTDDFHFPATQHTGTGHTDSQQGEPIVLCISSIQG